MREHERRYRRSVGQTNAQRARDGYRKAADKQAAQKANSQFTYDEYIESLKDKEKIFEVSEDSKVERLLDLWDEYRAWVAKQKATHLPKLQQKAKGSGAKIKTGVTPALTRVKTRVAGELDKLYERFGRRNVQFSGITGITVLVLLGGFIVFSGGGDAEVAVESQNGEVQGVVENPDPTFDVVKPDTVPDTNDVFFDPSLGVASYQDEIEGVTITISQQPLTDKQKVAKGTFRSEVATNLQAETSFETQYGETYIANASDDTGDQVVFFLTEELLVFLRTRDSQLSPLQWIDYINAI